MGRDFGCWIEPAPASFIHVFDIIALRPRHQMLGVAASLVVALMANDGAVIFSAVLQRSIGDLVCYAMSQVEPSVDLETSMAVGRRCGHPVPAFIRFAARHFLPEALNVVAVDLGYGD